MATEKPQTPQTAATVGERRFTVTKYTHAADARKRDPVEIQRT